MSPLQIFAAVLALAMATLIVWLLRHDRLPVSHSIWWLAVALLIAVFGLAPGLIDALARLTGIAYPPSLLFLLAILTLLIKVLHEDLEVSTTRRRMLRLAQKTAILEQEIEKLKQRLAANDKA
mgnify:CR=1 FL=1